MFSQSLEGPVHGYEVNHGDKHDGHEGRSPRSGLRRDHRRRRAQRPGRGGLPGPLGGPDPGARGQEQDRRRRDDGSPVAGRARLQGHPAVVRDVAAAPEHHQGPPAGTARLQDLPDGPVLPGLSRRRVDQALCRRRPAQPRRGVPLVEEGRRRHAALGRLAGRPGRGARPAAAHRAAEPRFPPAQGPQGDPPAGLAAPRPERPHDRRRDPADDDVRSPTCSTTGSSRRRSRGHSRSTA